MLSILIYFSIGVVVGYLAWVSLGSVERKIQSEGETSESLHREELILKFIENKDEVRNHDIQKLLGVSDATATRYLQKIEDKGKIKQIGEAGRSVYYKLN